MTNFFNIFLKNPQNLTVLKSKYWTDVTATKNLRYFKKIFKQLKLNNLRPKTMEEAAEELLYYDYDPVARIYRLRNTTYITQSIFADPATTTSNTSHFSTISPYPTWHLALFGLLASCVSVVTIAGNLVVILSFIIVPSIRQPSNYFIASLAVSDLLIGVVSMPFYTIYLLFGEKWPLGPALCDLWLSVDYTLCMCSIYTVFCITVDRFCSVKHPAKYRKWRTSRKVGSVVFATWAVPIFVFFTTIIGWQFFTNRTVPPEKCYVQYLEVALFNCILQIGYFWITLAAMITLYIAIYRVASDLHRRSEAKRNQNMAALFSMAGKTVNHMNSVLAMTYKPNEALENVDETRPLQAHDVQQNNNGNFIESSKHHTCSAEKLHNASNDVKAIEENICKVLTSTQPDPPSIVVHRVSSEESQESMHNQQMPDSNKYFLQTQPSLLKRPVSTHDKLCRTSIKKRKHHSFDASYAGHLGGEHLWESTFKIQDYQQKHEKYCNAFDHKISSRRDETKEKYGEQSIESHPVNNLNALDNTHETEGKNNLLGSKPSNQNKIFNFNLVYIDHFSNSKSKSILEPLRAQIATAMCRLNVPSLLPSSRHSIDATAENPSQQTEDGKGWLSTLVEQLSGRGRSLSLRSSSVVERMMRGYSVTQASVIDNKHNCELADEPKKKELKGFILNITTLK